MFEIQSEMISPSRKKLILAALCIVGSLLLVLIDRVVDEPIRGILQSLIYIGMILAGALIGGWRFGFILTSVALFVALTLFTSPYLPRLLTSLVDFIRILAFICIGVTLSLIGEALQRAWRRIDDRQRLLEQEVVERRKAQAAEQNRADELMTTLASIGDGVIRTDSAGLVTYLNLVAEMLVGCTSDAAKGKPLNEVFHVIDSFSRLPVDNPAVRALRNDASIAPANHPILIALNGSERPIEESASVIRNAAGATTGCVLVFRDISERRKAEIALRESEARFRALMEQAPFSIQSFSPTGKTRHVNRAWEELWGLKLNQLEEYNILQDRQLEQGGLIEFIRRGFSGETAYIPPMEYDPNRAIAEQSSLRQDPLRWVSAVIYPLKDDQGQIQEVVIVHDDLTARKKAEDELKLTHEVSEHQRRIFETALSNTADFNYVFDVDGRFLFVNRPLLNLWKRRLADVVGKNISELGNPPQLPERLQEHIQTVLRTRRPVRGETQFPATDEDRAYEYIFVPVIGEQGAVEAVAGSTRDVTERKKMERALQLANHRLAEALSAGAIATWTWEITQDIVAIHAEMAKDFQALSDHPTGVPVSEFLQLIHPDDRVQVQHGLSQAVQDGSEYETDFRLIDKEGTIRWFTLRGRVERNEEGRLQRMNGVLVDISERKVAEQALRDSEKRYRAIGESIDYGVWICDSEGRNTYASDCFLQLVGLTQKECAEFGWESVLHPQDVQGTIAAWKDCVSRGDRWDREHRFKGVDGQWYDVLARGVPIRNESGVVTSWVGINLDISRLKRVEAELRDADRRKDEFLATLAHELRNPLAPIGNSLQILKMPNVDAETAKQSREMMERQVHHLVRLVDDLLDVSRVMRGKIELRMERVELATVVARAVETARPVIDAQGHRLEISLPLTPLPLNADPVRLAQVIGNLLNNSAKYTESNGHIWFSACQENDQIVFSVRDDGIGIDQELLPHIFGLFVQADHSSTKSQGGLGIGLTLVKSLVEMHGGTVVANSPGLGKGCEVVVRLPLLREVVASNRETDGESGHQSIAPSGLRLLVVDDNRDAALSLVMLLQMQGHEVKMAQSGPAALEFVAEYRPHLVLLDLGMPVMDGYEVVSRMRQIPELQQTVITALTGWGQEEDRRRTAQAGFDHHLVKPLDPQLLQKIIGTLKLSPKDTVDVSLN